MIKFVILALCVSSAWTVPSRVIPKKIIDGRIIGGSVARAAQFPFSVAIYFNTIDGNYFGAGALISNDFVLTAGQCVYGVLLFTLHIGGNSLSGNEPASQRLSTDIYYIHPEYDPVTFAHDVGLIKFRLPITFNDYIQPISILANTLLPDYSSVVTIGWGQTSDQTPGIIDELNYVYLTSLSDNDCKQTFGNQVTENMVCVDGNYNEGTCRGDLGSPLIQYGSRGITYHVGISSFISTNGCESTDPSGFTRTSIYREWIRNITQV